MLLKVDCRHFPGSRPCRFNKESGQTCPGCPHYQSKGIRILITKLDALGDVLRTTALLPGLKKKYPDSYIVWLTKAGAADLFKNNPYIDELWNAETDALSRVQAQAFDLVINPDADKWTASFATNAQAVKRLGMMLDKQGNIIPANKEAEEWLEMGAFDHLKKANQKSYQQLIFAMCKLDYAFQKPVLCLSPAERKWGREFLAQQGYDPSRKLIGLNLGGGGRWKRKRWTQEHILTLSKMIASHPGMQLLIIGGPWERELTSLLQKSIQQQVLFSGSDRSLRELAALIALCTTLVSGDTLALHVATALDVPVLGLFGPTSATEIELYGLGTKFVAPLDCCCCYLTDCSKEPNCMSLISPDAVFQAITQPCQQK